MIAKQSIGKSFMGALHYNLRKVFSRNEEERAELLETNFSTLDNSTVKKELEIMRLRNPHLQRNTYHASLNFSDKEQISNKTMLSIAKEYMERMGFDDNLYCIFRHHDTSHPHCHILALRNRFDGKVVSDSNNYQRSEKIVRELENKYGLIEVIDSKQSKHKAPTKDEIEMALRTGSPSMKMLLQEKVAAAIESSKDMGDFIGTLRKDGIDLLFNQARTGRVSGITYFMDGFMVTGRSLGQQFKWSSLLKEIYYEQAQHGEAIGQANDRTKAKYGERATGTTADHRQGFGGNVHHDTGKSKGVEPISARHSERHQQATSKFSSDGSATGEDRDDTFGDYPRNAGIQQAATENEKSFDGDIFPEHDTISRTGSSSWFDGLAIEITPDEDDERLKRKKRGLGR
ncbi:relaxase/mobilization nuclease domain-containing protein [Olivibacter sitiensis]|uniref:relaxase/mobilization nuclease domain-containing protein n=1 Tax=Olivibacter sitiensis TaxID=376470 RepID=UPI00040AC8D5|nr:relaxase/mobilization nuclease domain-containing protein [Olivibacter sitiensis]